MIEYLLIAIGFWLGAAMVNFETFGNQNASSYFLGVLGSLLWPLMLFMTWLDLRNRKKS